jgi:hypothetical protein
VPCSRCFQVLAADPQHPKQPSMDLNDAERYAVAALFTLALHSTHVESGVDRNGNSLSESDIAWGCPSEELFDEQLLSQVPLKLPQELLDVFWGFDCMAPAGLAPRLYAWLKVRGGADRTLTCTGRWCALHIRHCCRGTLTDTIQHNTSPFALTCICGPCGSPAHHNAPPADMHACPPPPPDRPAQVPRKAWPGLLRMPDLAGCAGSPEAVEAFVTLVRRYAYRLASLGLHAWRQQWLQLLCWDRLPWGVWCCCEQPSPQKSAACMRTQKSCDCGGVVSPQVLCIPGPQA